MTNKKSLASRLALYRVRHVGGRFQWMRDSEVQADGCRRALTDEVPQPGLVASLGFEYTPRGDKYVIVATAPDGEQAAFVGGTYGSWRTPRQCGLDGRPGLP
jgi:hypothetical protein